MGHGVAQYNGAPGENQVSLKVKLMSVFGGMHPIGHGVAQ